MMRREQNIFFNSTFMLTSLAIGNGKAPSTKYIYWVNYQIMVHFSKHSIYYFLVVYPSKNKVRTFEQVLALTKK